MKNKVIVISLVGLFFASVTYAQNVENDDMYFTSKDRAALKAQKAGEQAAYSASVKKAKKNQASGEEFYNNPTDSYSARNVNPEFAARSNSQVAQADNEDYFVSNYRYNNASELNAWNNNFNNWYGNPWYSSTYFGSGINQWNSPYYGSAYDSWGNPWGNPYYRSGWSSSFSYYWGSSWNYGWGNGMGWGMNYGWGNPYMNSWSAWGPSYGYGRGWGGYNNYYPGTIIIVNNGEGGGRNIAYGKRATRSGVVTSPDNSGTNNRTRSTYVATTPSEGRPAASGGRVATQNSSQRQEEYYNRSWRTSQQGTQTSTSTYPTRNSSNSSSNWGNSTPTRSTNNGSYNDNSRTNSSYSPARSSTPTRSSAPASSGSNGRTRGRD